MSGQGRACLYTCVKGRVDTEEMVLEIIRNRLMILFKGTAKDDQDKANNQKQRQRHEKCPIGWIRLSTTAIGITLKRVRTH